MSRFISLLLVLAVILSGLAVHLRNDQPVLFDYYLGSVELPFSLFIILSLCAGALLGILASLPHLFRLKREKARLLRQVRLAEKELDNLRIDPVKDPY